MTYIVNAVDATRPLNTDPRKQGAEELRALKLRVNQLQTTLEGADSTNASAAAAASATALAAANAAQGSANAAQGSANAAASAAAAAQGTADSALNLAQAIAFKNVVQLTGSGNWTVPDGVTQVLAIISSGGTASGSKEFYANVTVYVFGYYTIDLTSQRIGHNVKRIDVTPAQVISYDCGAGDVVRTDYANIGTTGGRSPNILQSVAQSTRFGTHYAHPEVPYIWQGVTSNIIMSDRLRTRQLVAYVDSLHVSIYPPTGTWFDGEAGRIVLLY